MVGCFLFVLTLILYLLVIVVGLLPRSGPLTLYHADGFLASFEASTVQVTYDTRESGV